MVEGIYMAAFNFAPNNNAGFKAIPLMNTAGHAKGTFYNFKLKNRKYESVAVQNITVQANATVLATEDEWGNQISDNGEFGVLLEDDYNGELMYVKFEHQDPDDVKFFDGAQAFYSTVN